VNHLERTRKAMKLLKRDKMKALEAFLQGEIGTCSTRGLETGDNFIDSE